LWSGTSIHLIHSSCTNAWNGLFIKMSSVRSWLVRPPGVTANCALILYLPSLLPLLRVPKTCHCPYFL
jgi:hypothetical protein